MILWFGGYLHFKITWLLGLDWEGDLINANKYLIDGCQVNEASLFFSSVQGSGQKLKHGKFHESMWKNLFTVR